MMVGLSVVKIGASLSTSPDTPRAAEEATREACRPLDGKRPSLAIAFASSHHAAEEVLEGVQRVASPEHMIGCVAEWVLGGAREVEDEPGVSVWVADLPGEVETFELQFVRTSEGGVLAGWHFDPAEGGTYLLMADPHTFPSELLLSHLNQNAPGLLAIGGVAGAGTGASRLFLDGRVLDSGATGARLKGVNMRTLVSQGCRPIGRPFVVTNAEENLILELGGRPPLDRLRSLVASLTPRDRELASRGLQLGRVIDEYKDELGRGDFLIRGLVGADQSTGAIAIGDHVEVGETVQFHVRDAATADEDLRTLLERESLEGGQIAGGLLFTCNGRGTRLFSTPSHDASLVSQILGGIPLAGFFAAGELGPVGGKNFLHGFTASMALFVDA
jgi:small ligand-binding sensory domain FIST